MTLSMGGDGHRHLGRTELSDNRQRGGAEASLVSKTSPYLPIFFSLGGYELTFHYYFFLSFQQNVIVLKYNLNYCMLHSKNVG